MSERDSGAGPSLDQRRQAWVATDDAPLTRLCEKPVKKARVLEFKVDILRAETLVRLA
jgi:hypothetical protein